ncbi:hypothetical protein KC19_8G100600 [Ceratodon purpureus]|uniref:Uncharacterized protein n=1 Tax=Ceratodon purpureus TaxID=3225 RepID=A0A8T0GX15_CERPU|nr:hypothetical protein KC19_8G100600 [Ceratodon purpureus]
MPNCEPLVNLVLFSIIIMACMCTAALIVMEKLYRFLINDIWPPDHQCEMSSLLWRDGEQEASEELGGLPVDETSNPSRSASRFMSVGFSDPAHHCKSIPCSYCGKDWPQLPSSEHRETMGCR